MTTGFTRFANILRNKLEPEVRTHLVKVYTCLTATTACATFGAILDITGAFEATILTAFLSLACIISLHLIRDNGKNLMLRLGLLLGFGFCAGQSLGPLLTQIILINPQIIVTALTGTCVAFVSFSLSALLAERGKFLFLGGILISIISTMTLFNLSNIFLRSYLIYQGQLYLGLVIMSAYILYDTQAIIEKCLMGNKDYIQHSLDLFFDLVGIFRRLLIILTQKEERKQNRRKSN